MWYCVFFFFKQKTAYEMRISDWSSDVCSSDLGVPAGRAVRQVRRDDQFAASPDLHAGDAVLPTLDEPAERELDARTAAPRGVELLAGVELHPGVVDGHVVAGLRFGAVSSAEHTSELPSLKRTSFHVYCS